MDNASIIEGQAVPVSNLNLGTLLKIPAVRQIILLFGLAGSVAAGFAIVLWAQTPEYSRLYGDLEAVDAAQITDALRAADIEFKVNMETGSVMVPDSRLHAARLELASQGLPQGASVGMASLREESTFGQSQFRENALYQHAFEAELAVTISHLGAVRDARVHLALPKQSAFIRDRKPSSASIMLNLFQNRELSADQTAAIVHLVASSVPNLLASNVTVIDQYGRLLSSGESQGTGGMPADHFALAERLERNYKTRIEELLTPLLGPARVRAEVAADMDFTVSEETRESYDPQRSALISESLTNTRSNGEDLSAQGIPGALSNQPPGSAGTDTANAAAQQTTAASSNTASSSIRNYEVERTVSHKRPQTGVIRRLSVAVLVDDNPAEGAASDAPQSVTDEDISRFTALVKEAVGFDAARGDSVVVISAAFQRFPDAAPPAELKLWEQPLIVDSLKQFLSVALVLILAFTLVRPMLKTLLATNAESTARISGAVAEGSVIPAGSLQLSPTGSVIPAVTFDEKMAAARNISGHDPAVVAQVVKKWVGSDDVQSAGA